MKLIIVDDLVKDNTQESASIKVDGIMMTGWQMAKPLNYDPEHISFLNRVEMAIRVLRGRAIGVSYFRDLSESEKIEYVKTQIK